MFVHGGVLPQHAQLGLERINEETRAWMRGESSRMPSYLSGRQAIVWAREYSAGKLMHNAAWSDGVQDAIVAITAANVFYWNRNNINVVCD